MLDKKLINLLGKRKKALIVITGLQVVNLLIAILISGLICFILNEIITYSNYIYLYFLLLVAFLIVLKLIITKSIGKLQSMIAEVIELNLRNQLNEKILSHHGEFKGFNSQSLTQLSIEGIEQLNLYYTVYIPQFFYSMISPILLFIIFCFISVPVALIFLACVPLIPISIIAISKYAKKIFNKYWDKYLSMGGDFLDNLKGLKELKIFLYDQKRQDELDSNAEEFRKITMKVLVMQLWSTSIMDLVAFGGAGIGLSVALYNLNNGTITSPFLALFLIIVGAEFFLPMRALGSAFHISMNGATAGRKILSILASSKAKEGEIKIYSIKSIELIDLNINYDETNIINNFNLDITDKGLYGLVGESGSGKSTILKLFSKDVKQASGKCLINGVELEKITDKSLYQRLCFISYQSHLFSKSLKENFLIVNPKAEEEKMKRALELVGLEDFSLDFIFQEDGSNVSGGQKQRFILAFYLTKDYDFYIMDEVTSNIDEDSEKIIIENILEISKSKKVLMVSHRLHNLLAAKSIYFINKMKNQIVGNHYSLLSSCQEYKELFSMQQKIEGSDING